MTELHWWQRGVIYEIYVRSFQDSTGDGVGDLGGIIERLDYLNGTDDSLGVDALWLTPFYPSPMADFGYDVKDYCDVDPLFGDLETFDRLVEEAHTRDLKVIIDYVPNHTSDEHPWFIESRSSRDNPKRDWYIWRDPKPDGSPPNNWGSYFGGPAWTYDESTGQYYLHQFAREQPDLNWRNPEVRDAMYDVLRFWLERGVDGFRIDVVGLIIKDEQLRDNPPDPDVDIESLHPNDIQGRHKQVYNLDQDEVFDILTDFRQIMDEYGDTYAVGELWFDLPRWVKYYGEEGRGLHMPFNFRLIHQPWDAQAMQASVDEMEAALPKFAWPNYVLGSHDFPRLASRIGAERMRLAAMLLLSLRGTPTLYYGDELAIPNVEISEDQVQDPQGKILGVERTRDVARTPMQWDASEHAGFCAPETEPWLPFTEDYEARNVEVMSDEPASLLNLYRKLLRYRRDTPALHGGDYRPLHAGNNDCFVFLREHGDERRLVALNFTGEAQKVNVREERQGAIALSTHLDREGDVDLTNLQLRPNEGLIVAL